METIVQFHSIWRWAVLAGAVLAIAGALAARRDRATGWGSRMGLLYTIAIDVQVLLGLILWVGNAWWQGNLFFAFIHPVTMLLALGAAHMARSRQRRGASGAAPWVYVASLVLVLLGIPRA